MLLFTQIFTSHWWLSHTWSSEYIIWRIQTHNRHSHTLARCLFADPHTSDKFSRQTSKRHILHYTRNVSMDSVQSKLVLDQVHWIIDFCKRCSWCHPTSHAFQFTAKSNWQVLHTQTLLHFWWFSRQLSVMERVLRSGRIQPQTACSQSWPPFMCAVHVQQLLDYKTWCRMCVTHRASRGQHQCCIMNQHSSVQWRWCVQWQQRPHRHSS